ncbi:MAG: hypothetical protein GX461_06675 [Clostridiales bacterium]|nr:hypothetical protein [Clostridiales bacterium]
MKIRIIICIVLAILCFFLLSPIVGFKLNELMRLPKVTEEWLNIQSPDGSYSITVISSRSNAMVPSGKFHYTLDIYCQNTKEQTSDGPKKHCFTTRIGPIKHGLKDENYEIEWIDNGAILKFKDHRQSLSFVLDFEELFSEISK